MSDLAGDLVDRRRPHVRLVVARSMVDVEPGTGIPGLEDITPALLEHGFQLVGFESVNPDEQRGPTPLRPTLEKLRALREAVADAIREIECYGDAVPVDDDSDDGEDLFEDLAVSAHQGVEDAWRAYDRHYHQEDR